MRIRSERMTRGRVVGSKAGGVFDKRLNGNTHRSRVAHPALAQNAWMDGAPTSKARGTILGQNMGTNMGTDGTFTTLQTLRSEKRETSRLSPVFPSDLLNV